MAIVQELINGALSLPTALHATDSLIYQSNTARNGTAINKIMVYNTSGSAEDVTLYLYRGGGFGVGVQWEFYFKEIPAKVNTYAHFHQEDGVLILKPDDELHGIAGTGSVINVLVFGLDNVSS